jgi:serine/threonine protein kinase
LLEPGALIAGRFLVRGLASRGGTGLIYRADDRETGAAAAIKLPARPDEGGAARLEREARLLATLSHPNVVGYLASGITPGS